MTHDAIESAPQDVPAREDGFTLVEVIWALFLLGIIAMAALGFFIHGMKSIAHVQREQAAVSLANSAMDLARSVPPGSTDANLTSGLLRGRNQADVTATWNAATTANSTDTSDMKIAWDKQLGVLTADQWVPVTTTATVDNQKYTIDTLVGKCWRFKAATTTSQDCIGTDPVSDTYIQMYRVRVVVRWDESADGTRKHTYRLSTLVDPSADATWNTVLKPYAYDDEIYPSAGETSPCLGGILLNDTGTFDSGKNPITVESSPAYVGTVTAPNSCPTGVLFTAPNTSGLTAFNYHVTSTAGQVSPPATVTVHIVPKPVAKTIYVTGTKSTDITSLITSGDPGLTNLDSSRTTSVIPARTTTYNPFPTLTSSGDPDVFNLQGIGISMSGANVIFDPSKSPSGTTFYYWLVDSPKSGTAASYHGGAPAAVTIKVDATMLTPNKTAPDITVAAAASPYTSNPIDWQGLTGNPTTTKIQVTGVTSALGAGTYDANVYLDGKKYTTSGIDKTGSVLTFMTNNASTGTYVITYRAVAPSGTPSATSGTITVNVLPLANNYTFSNKINSGDSVDLTAAGIVPTSDVQATEVAPVGTANCTVSSSALKVAVTFKAGKSSCQFTYKLVTTNTTKYPTALTSSAPGTITVSKK